MVQIAGLLKLFFTITHELPSRASLPRAMAPDQLEPCSFRPPLNGWWPRYTWQWHPRYRIGSPGNTSPNEVGMWQSNKKNGWFPQVSLFSLKSLVLSLSVEGKFPNAWQSVLLTRCHRLAQHWGQEVEKSQQRYGAQISWFTVKEQNTVPARQLENSFQIALELGCPVEFIFSPPWRRQISFDSQWQKNNYTKRLSFPKQNGWG